MHVLRCGWTAALVAGASAVPPPSSLAVSAVLSASVVAIFHDGRVSVERSSHGGRVDGRRFSGLARLLSARDAEHWTFGHHQQTQPYRLSASVGREQCENYQTKATTNHCTLESDCETETRATSLQIECV